MDLIDRFDDAVAVGMKVLQSKLALNDEEAKEIVTEMLTDIINLDYEALNQFLTDG